MSVIVHLLYFLALASLGYGAWLVFHPAGFLVLGLFLLLIAFTIDREKERRGQ